MGTKLNPDGIKIRTLRVQRGWTQEQLAEIAGISLRTIQRAEAANSAAFETIRAIAAAFETDFDQLLKNEPCQAVNQEMPMANSLSMIPPYPMPEQIVVRQPAVNMRRSWGALLIAVPTLAMGLTIGIFITDHLHKHSEPLPSASHAVSTAPLHVAESSRSLPSDKDLPRAAVLKPRLVRDPASKHEISKPEMAGTNEKQAPFSSLAQEADPSASAKAPSLQLVQPSSPPDLLMQSPTPIVPLAIAEIPIDWNAASSLSVDSIQESQEPGAVRQALGIAARKTSGFISKARASIKRAF
jgi:transcriptional regulator with XRE-family HTH domain